LPKCSCRPSKVRHPAPGFFSSDQRAVVQGKGSKREVVLHTSEHFSLETLSAGLEAQPKWLRAFFTTLRDSFNSYDLHDIMKDLFIDEHYLTKADIRR